MPTSASARLRHAMSEAGWAQWTSLGVLGTTPMIERRCLDPEALIWFTFAGGIDDGRLIDCARDWLARNKRFVSVHRLRNIFGHDVEPLRAAMAALGGNLDRPKPRFKTATKVVAPDPLAPENLAIRLRLLFDAGVRSEVIRFLLTQSGRGEDAQSVADAAMFAKRNVHDTLLALVRSGVATEVWEGNRRVFSVERERWCTFIGIDQAIVPPYVSWVKVFGAATALVRWLEDDERASESTSMRASNALQLVDEIKWALVASGVEIPTSRGLVGDRYLAPFDALVERVADFLAPEPNVEVRAS